MKAHRTGSLEASAQEVELFSGWLGSFDGVDWLFSPTGKDGLVQMGRLEVKEQYPDTEELEDRVF